MKPKSIKFATRLSLGALSVGVLVACGGGSAGGGIGIADGGIRGTGSSVGPVSGFGSVFVNGVRFDTSDLNGQVIGDDGISQETELDEGMILRVDGEWQENGEGTAREMEYDDTLRGPIVVGPNYNQATQLGVISVLGLTVRIDRQTVIKGALQPVVLNDDDEVRVSGWRLADGSFRASLVRVNSVGANSTAFDVDNDIEIEGRIENLILGPCSFNLGSVSVDCNSLSMESPMNPGDLEEGEFVEVEGSLNIAGDEVSAAEIRQDDRRRYRRGIERDIEFSGPVTEDFDPFSDSAVVNGITVNITPDTDFDDDLTASDLLSGLLVQVEGDYQSDGTINADEIELREANAKVKGSIDGDISQTERAFTVGGVRLQVTALTLIEDDDDGSELTRDQLFELLASGDDLEVEGIERGTDTAPFIEALKIEREEAEEDGDQAEFELEGKLRAVSANSITVLGIEIEVDFAALGCTSAELQELLNDRGGSFPTIEVGYEPTGSPGLFTYIATDIKSGDDGVPEVECDD